MTDVTDSASAPPYKRDNKGRFIKGTAGKQPGMRARLSKRAFRQVAENLDLIVAALLAKAMNGDTDAARILLGQVLPKDQPVDLPELSAQSIADAVMSGEVTPAEGRTLATTLAKLCEIVDVGELRARLDELERTLAGRAVR